MKQSKNAKTIERYGYLRITVNGKACEVSTKRVWQTDKWNAKRGRATGNKESARELNSYLDLITAQVYDVKKTLVSQGKPVSSEVIKKVLLRGYARVHHTRTDHVRVSIFLLSIALANSGKTWV